MKPQVGDTRKVEYVQFLHFWQKLQGHHLGEIVLEAKAAKPSVRDVYADVAKLPDRAYLLTKGRASQE